MYSFVLCFFRRQNFINFKERDAKEDREEASTAYPEDPRLKVKHLTERYLERCAKTIFSLDFTFIRFFLLFVVFTMHCALTVIDFAIKRVVNRK